MTKLFGDVSEEDRELEAELIVMENLTDSDDLPLERKAQIYICVANDWLNLGLDEECSRLLLKARIVCPRYLNDYMHKHIKEDRAFKNLINYLILSSDCDIMNILKT